MAARSILTPSRAREPPFCAVCRSGCVWPGHNPTSRAPPFEAGPPGAGSDSRYAFRRRVLEMQRLAGMDERMDRMRCQRRLGEAGEDQLELAGVGRDIADREDPRPRGGAGRRIDADPVVIEPEIPGSERAKIGGK